MTTKDADVQTLKEFCARNRIARPTFYKLKANGQAPRTFRVGRKVLVTNEAAQDWRRDREQQTARQESL